MSARIVLVDDHTLVRAGIRSLLEDCGYRVVAEGADGDQVLDLLQVHHPDVLVMDISMSRCSGFEALSAARAAYPCLPVVLLSMHDTQDFVLKAIHLGASAYLLKDAAELELELALRAVLDGQRYLSPRISGRLVEAMQAPASGIAADESLTARQREVLYWLAKGKSNKEIAFILDLSVKTVDAHRAQLMERLNIRNLAGLVVYAVRHGVIKVDE